MIAERLMVEMACRDVQIWMLSHAGSGKRSKVRKNALDSLLGQIAPGPQPESLWLDAAERPPAGPHHLDFRWASRNPGGSPLYVTTPTSLA